MSNYTRMCKMWAGLILIFLLGYPTHETLAQEKEKFIQFSGVLMSSDSLYALPYATVRVMNSGRGTITNERGFFTVVVAAGDSVLFSHIGFLPDIFIIPDNLEDVRYAIIQLLSKDVYHLPETVIYPWPSKETFKEAFLTLEIPDDDMERAKKNLERDRLAEAGKHLPEDANTSVDYYTRQQTKKLYYYGQQPPMRIFDPLAWAEFIKAWKRGDFKRNKND